MIKMAEKDLNRCHLSTSKCSKKDISSLASVLSWEVI
jgi:hypothetical protein